MGWLRRPCDREKSFALRGGTGGRLHHETIGKISWLPLHQVAERTVKNTCACNLRRVITGLDRRLIRGHVRMAYILGLRGLACDF